MAEQHNVVAYLYAATGTEGADAAAFAINPSINKARYVESRRQASDSPQALDDWTCVEREQTEEPEDDDYDGLENSEGLMIALDIIPKGQRGTEVGYDPLADISLPNVPGVSYRHFSLTFNDDYCLVVRDLKSTVGTTVSYGGKEVGPFFDTERVVGGSDFLRGKNQPIVIKATARVQFRLVVEPFDPSSKEFRDGVDRYRAGSGQLEEIFEGVGIRAPTQPQTEAQTPVDSENVQLVRRIGQGRSSVVQRVFDVKTGRQHALREALAPYNPASWSERAAKMSLISHEHIVAFLFFQAEPSPALHLEYVPGGTLKSHLDAGRYFSESERVQVTRQTTSALAYLHGLHPAIVHRDISTKSTFVHHRGTDAIVIKLGDVGAPESGPDVDGPTHLAPELFGESPSGQPPVMDRYTSAADVWALGAVLAELVCGLPDVESDGWVWCGAITRRLRDNFEKTTDQLAHFLLEHMLRLKPEDRKEARHCYQRSLLLHDGPPAGGVTMGTVDAVGDARVSDGEENETEGSEREENEGSEENESEEDSSGTSDSEDDDASEVETVVEAEPPAARGNRAHNTLELLTPAATSVSASDDDGGAETPQAFGRSDAPSPSTTAAAERRIYELINEPTASLCGESGFGESIFDDSTVDIESIRVDDSDLIHEPGTSGAAATGGGDRDSRSVASSALASTVPQKRLLDAGDEEHLRAVRDFLRDGAAS
ncbi:kinase-like domain-containing protein [Xylaria venustula]|nr:kinase-like domain-containing protein [Xylaria venustula]